MIDCGNISGISAGDSCKLPRGTIIEKLANGSYEITVGKGDNLYRIAKKLGTTDDVLAAQNGIKNKHLVRVGQKITYVPKKGKAKDRHLPTEAARGFPELGTRYQEIVEKRGPDPYGALGVVRKHLASGQQLEPRDKDEISGLKNPNLDSDDSEWFDSFEEERNLPKVSSLPADPIIPELAPRVVVDRGAVHQKGEPDVRSSKAEELPPLGDIPLIDNEVAEGEKMAIEVDPKTGEIDPVSAYFLKAKLDKRVMDVVRSSFPGDSRDVVRVREYLKNHPRAVDYKLGMINGRVAITQITVQMPDPYSDGSGRLVKYTSHLPSKTPEQLGREVVKIQNLEDAVSRLGDISI